MMAVLIFAAASFLNGGALAAAPYLMEGTNGASPLRSTAAASNGTLVANYKQCDPEWACFPYVGATGDCTKTHCAATQGGSNADNICASGCGITSSAMILSFLTSTTAGNLTSIKPPVIAKLLIDAGYRNFPSGPNGSTCDGVSQIAECAMAAHYGFQCESFPDIKQAQALAASGSDPLIAHVRAKGTPNTCKFTSGGHYIVLTSFDESKGLFHVNDPASSSTARATGTPAELSEGCSLVGFVHMHAGGSGGSSSSSLPPV